MHRSSVRTLKRIDINAGNFVYEHKNYYVITVTHAQVGGVAGGMREERRSAMLII